MVYNRKNIVTAVNKALGEHPDLEDKINQALRSQNISDVEDIHSIEESQLSMLIFKLIQADPQVFGKLMSQATRKRSRSQSPPRRSRSKSRSPPPVKVKRTIYKAKTKYKKIIPVSLSDLTTRLDTMPVRSGRFDYDYERFEEPDWPISPKKESKKKGGKRSRSRSKSPRGRSRSKSPRGRSRSKSPKQTRPSYDIRSALQKRRRLYDD
ncbi:hypothetical protein EBU71_14640 [bacterium]|nr:hypothetical protein [Candidatus Elulimicrobium humile]